MASRLNSAGDMPPDKLHNSWIYEIRGFIHRTMTNAYTSSRLHKLPPEGDSNVLQKGTCSLYEAIAAQLLKFATQALRLISPGNTTNSSTVG